MRECLLWKECVATHLVLVRRPLSILLFSPFATVFFGRSEESGPRATLANLSYSGVVPNPQPAYEML